MRGLIIVVAALLAAPLAGAIEPDGVVNDQGPRHGDETAWIDAALQRGRRTADKLRASRGAFPQVMQHGVELKWPLRESVGFQHASVQAISNFLDQDNNSGDDAIEDWNCSAPNARTYDGHRGLDIFLTPFSWYQMTQDSGIVIAAAPGVIVDKVNDQPETSCSIDNPVGDNNLVMIEHADGSYGIYAHMRTGSVTHKPIGATVDLGEYLGVVGSSGLSTGPHLHFEVGFFEGNTWTPQDPFAGACNAINDDSWWENQPPYHVPAVVQIATHSAEPESVPCPQVEEPHYSDDFDAGDSIVFSVAFRDLLRDVPTEVVVRQPNGSVFVSTTYAYDQGDHVTGQLIWYNLDLPANAPSGTWIYEVTFNGETTTHPFRVNRAPPSSPSIGAGNNRYNGVWYDPALSGDGYNIVTSSVGTAIYFYGNDTFGERLWLTSELITSPFQQGVEYDIAMMESTGGVYAQPIQSGRGLAYWGLLRLRFTDCETGTASLVGNDGAKQSSLVKITGVPGSECIAAQETDQSKFSGLWYDPNLSGEGFNLIVTPNGTVLYYYGFDTEGERLWMITAPFNFSFANGESTVVDLLKATSGTFIAPVPSGQTLQPWGTVEVTGQNCNAIRFELDTAEGTKVMNARRLVGVAGLGC